MSFLRSTKPSIRHLSSSIKHHRVRYLSTTAGSGGGGGVDPDSSWVLRWVSGIAVGSTFGALLYPFSPYNNNNNNNNNDNDNDKNDVNDNVIGRIKGNCKSMLSFADWSAAPTSAEAPSTSHPPLSLSYKKPRFLFKDSYRRKVFFKYEKRIRTRSPPEKVFEYFSSVRNSDGEILMKPSDLMRAVVPVFPPSESELVRDGYLPGERPPGELRCPTSEFFMLFDVNNDGLISFKEYIFFVTLLSIPESSFSVAFKMFDIDNNGEIDRDEFKQVMALMRAQHRQGANHRDGLRTGIRAGVKIGGAVENGGVVEYFFGEDGETQLHHDKFVQFLRHLHDEIVRLEFSHYDYKSQGTISAKDFALSMVASADINHINKLLDRVDDIDNNPNLSNVRVTEHEFRKFAELRMKLEPFALALFAYGKVNGLLTKADFQRAASRVCGVSLSDSVVDVIYHVFDSNRDGNLSAEEFLRVLQKRTKEIAQPVESGIMGFLNCCWDCKNRCSLSRLLS
ncbi:calcium uptake protein, mitochondrial-like [Silene latifolia]|uniref:calcium uptake protein, mitochondrial-like n=1 Tax=Silene latifolia TaxID=37657 RepID=UPI003D77EF3B